METIIVTSDNWDTIIDSVTKEMNGYTLRIYRELFTEGGRAYPKVEVYNPYVKGDYNVSICNHAAINEIALRVQTTSWGALSVPELEKVLEKYRKAIEVCNYVNQINWDEVPILMFKN